MDKYLRLYCSKCKLLYDARKSRELKYCSQCGRRLRYKSLNPWPKFGLAVIFVAIYHSIGTGGEDCFFESVPELSYAVILLVDIFGG